MSRVHDILRSAQPHSARKWYLKLHDGTVFGPVDIATLCEWAAQSRVAPGNQVSEDRTDWVPAQNLPELKMEWQVQLPDGEHYGPFNVRAVPHLVQNGVLPAESKLTNRLSGRTLQVSDLVKPVQPPAHVQKSLFDDTAELAPAEQKHLGSSIPAIDGAERARALDMKTRPPLIEPEDSGTAKGIKDLPLFHPEPIVAAPLQPKDRETAEGTGKVEDVAAPARRETEEGKSRRSTAEKEMAARKKEEDLQRRLEQADRDLQQARDELSSLKQKATSDPQGIDSVVKLAQKKEQDLTRSLEETRRKAEADAAMLYRVKAQLEELKVQKGDLQNRSLKEENIQKTRIQEMEKQILALNTEVQSQKTQYQLQEREIQSKQERLQAQANQYKEKAETAAGDLTRLKKELEAQKSLYVDAGKSVGDKETNLLKEIRTARSAQASAENELAVLRKQLETLRNQASHRETELQARIDQLGIEARNAQTATDNVKKEFTLQAEESKKLDKRVRSLEAELDKVQQVAKQAQEDRLILETRARKQAEELSRFKTDLDIEKNSAGEIKSRQQEEKIQLATRIEQLQAENKTHLARIQDIEKSLTAQKQEAEKIRSQSVARETQLGGKVDELRNELQTTKNELVSTRQKSLEERRNLEALEKQARTKEQETRRLLEDATASSGSKNSQLEKVKNELADAKASLATLQANQPKSDAKLKKNVDADDTRLAELEAALNEARQELAARKETNASAAQDSALEKTVETLKAELAAKESRLTETTAKLQDCRKELEVGPRTPMPLEGVDFLADRRSMVTRIVAMLLFTALACLTTFIVGQRTTRAKLETQAKSEALVAALLQPTTPPAVTAPSVVPTAAAPTVRTTSPIPRLNVPHATATYTDKSCTVIFDVGLFSSRTNLIADAMDILDAVSTQVKDSLKDYRLIIEGHSDSTKLTLGTTVEDNYALGLARANRVLDILATKFNLPADAMVATSTGEKDPPFPNSDESLRKKNRTVVLKLSPK